MNVKFDPKRPFSVPCKSYTVCPKMFVKLSLLLFYLSLSFGYGDKHCPSPELIKPCRCENAIETVVEVLCTGIDNVEKMSTAFGNVPDWSFDILSVIDCTLQYIPQTIMEDTHYGTLRVSNTTLTTLFDYPPTNSKFTKLYMNEVTISRGLVWELFATLELHSMWIENTLIPRIGKSFAEHAPIYMNLIILRNTKTESIGDNAFASMTNLNYLKITRSYLRVMKRSMFSNPSGLRHLDLSYNLIESLPDDFTEGFKELLVLDVSHNRLTTLSHDVFSKAKSNIATDNPINCNCLVKWIPERSAENFISGSCTAPNDVKGKRLGDLTKDDFLYCQKATYGAENDLERFRNH